LQKLQNLALVIRVRGNYAIICKKGTWKFVSGAERTAKNVTDEGRHE